MVTTAAHTTTATNGAALAMVEKPKAEVRNLSFYYGKNKALKNVSLPVADKTVTALIGPSDAESRRCCGASTECTISTRKPAMKERSGSFREREHHR